MLPAFGGFILAYLRLRGLAAYLSPAIGSGIDSEPYLAFNLRQTFSMDGNKTALSNTKNTRRDRKSKRLVRDEPLAEDERKETHTGRIHIRITFRRKRLIDPDNLVAKYVIDCLRYAGAIPNDRASDVTIETHQEKSREEEETVVELFYEPEAVR